MGEPIQVGDLVRVVAVCCEKRASALGRFGLVAKTGQARLNCRDCCGYKGQASSVLVPDAHSVIGRGYFESHWLKRIPPLSDDERETEKLDLDECERLSRLIKENEQA